MGKSYVTHEMVIDFETGHISCAVIYARQEDSFRKLRFTFRDVTLPIAADEKDTVEYGGQRPDGVFFTCPCQRICGDVYEAPLRQEDLLTPGEMTLQLRIMEPEKEGTDYRRRLHSPPFKVVISKNLKVPEEFENND